MLPGLLSSFISTTDVIKFYDISLVDKEGGVYPVSKIIMAGHSNVIRNIFTYEADKCKTNFYLEAVPGLGLERGVESLLSWANVEDVLETAEFLDIPLVSSLCQEWLETRMHCFLTMPWGSGG